MDVWGLALMREMLSTLLSFVFPFTVGAAVSHFTTRAAYHVGRKHEREMLFAFLKQGAEWQCPCDKCTEARKQAAVLQKN